MGIAATRDLPPGKLSWGSRRRCRPLLPRAARVPLSLCALPESSCRSWLRLGKEYRGSAKFFLEDHIVNDFCFCGSRG